MTLHHVLVRLLLIGSAGVGCAGSTASAQSVLEIESLGQMTNNTVMTAQPLPASAFSANTSASVFGTLPTAQVLGRLGGSDVDIYSFVAQAGMAHFDIDSAAPGLDTYLALFNASGTLLGDNDDSEPGDAGSTGVSDAFLGRINLSAGLYFIAVARSGNFANATFTGQLTPIELFRPDGAFGGFAFGDADAGVSSFAMNGPQSDTLGYTLSISIVPSPTAVSLGGLGLLLSARRRRGAC